MHKQSAGSDIQHFAAPEELPWLRACERSSGTCLHSPSLLSQGIREFYVVLSRKDLSFSLRALLVWRWRALRIALVGYTASLLGVYRWMYLVKNKNYKK